ncbi:MAG TPA: hypothetical protein VFX05_04775 [Casimicrobiaceae bacterium]|nr:hypothetical protein [Casimicrobiaceae bacterium]
MSARADRRAAQRVPAARAPRRVEIDRTWLLRIGLAVVVVVGLVLVARVSMLAFGGAGKRLQRFEQQSAPPAPAASTATHAR